MQAGTSLGRARWQWQPTLTNHAGNTAVLTLEDAAATLAIPVAMAQYRQRWA